MKSSKKRKILGEGYLCVGVKPIFFKCECVEGDWIGLVDKNGKRICFADKVPMKKTKIRLIVEWKGK